MKLILDLIFDYKIMNPNFSIIKLLKYIINLILLISNFLYRLSQFYYFYYFFYLKYLKISNLIYFILLLKNK